MKTKIATLIIATAFAYLGFSDTITNYVYVVSNAYVHTYHENVITQKVKNTHYNYYYTNYLQDIIYESRYIVQTNMAYTQMFDVSQQAINQAQQYANQAANSASSANSSKNSAASSSSSAWSASSSASSSASAAASSLASTRAYGTQIINDINAEKAWFDDHFGEMVTNVNVSISITSNINVSVTTNIYHNEDTVARTNASEALAIATALAGEVGEASQLATNAYNIAMTNKSDIDDIQGSLIGVAPGVGGIYTYHVVYGNYNFLAELNSTNFVRSTYYNYYYAPNTQYRKAKITIISGSIPGSLTIYHYHPDYSPSSSAGKLVFQIYSGATITSTDKSNSEYELPSTFSNYITLDSFIVNPKYVKMTMLEISSMIYSISNWVEQTFQKK